MYNRSEADRYRRRKLPQYLIAREISEFPCYVCQSELSKAFNSISHIVLRVYIMNYASLIKSASKRPYDLFIEITESLVTSSKETVKNVLYAVKKRYGVDIRPQSEDWMLILKVDGYREFFKGNYQLLAYERVRICLRKKKERLNLILTEIPKIHVDKNFPPLFHTEEGQKFDFNNIHMSSPYFWYPPLSNMKKQIKLWEKNYYTHKDKKSKYLVRVPPEKVRIPTNIIRKRRKGTLYQKPNEIIVLRSGNWNYRFRFKLIGFERLCKVFNEVIIGEEATDNKATRPRNVTLKYYKKKEFK